MEKIKVLEACIELQEERIKGLKKILEKTRQQAIDAPGANVSHSDTTKFQQSNLALGIESRIMEAQKILSLLKALSGTYCDIITVGSFFVLKDLKSGETTNYLFVTEGGGDRFQVNDKEILSISGRAPLAKTIRGKIKNDEVEFRNKIFEIIDIQ